MPYVDLPTAPDGTPARSWVQRSLATLVAAGHMRLALQPIVELASEAVVGHEALLRWPEGPDVAVPPAVFIPVAEESGLIGPLGRWVLDRAVAVAVEGSPSSGGAPAWVSVNVSPAQLHDGALVGHVARALDRHGLDPRLLALEITENLAVTGADALRTLRALRRLGCPIGIDDFGAGLSCLSYLNRLPVDFIKVDRSLVGLLGQDPCAERILRAIGTMAGDLGIEALAEGIETDVQAQLARGAGCTLGQGFRFGRPCLAS